MTSCSSPSSPQDPEAGVLPGQGLHNGGCVRGPRGAQRHTIVLVTIKALGHVLSLGCAFGAPALCICVLQQHSTAVEHKTAMFGKHPTVSLCLGTVQVLRQRPDARRQDAAAFAEAE